VKRQLDRAHPIPDTSVFDGLLSRRGYRLNKMCGTLCSPENRAAFKGDEEAYMARFRLTEQERALVPERARRVHRHYYAPMTTGMGLITFEGAS
jgi:protocatechuate 4,5-dioxygenase alpha subunit